MKRVRSSRSHFALKCLAVGLLYVPLIALAGIPVQSGHSGSWFDPARSGEGFLLEVDQNNQLVAYWFTYDDEGEQQWVVGAGSASGDDQNKVTVPVIVTSGATFGDDFDPDDVVRTPWGTLTFEFDSCDALSVDYDSVVGFGSGTRDDLQPLTILRNSACEDNAPDVLGTYPQGALGTQLFITNCSDGSAPVGLPVDSSTLVIADQAGTDISGTLSFQATVPPGIVIAETGTVEGTVLENGSIQGQFETTSTVDGEPDGGTIGTFSTLIGDSTDVAVFAQGTSTDADGVTCTVLAISNLEKTE